MFELDYLLGTALINSAKMRLLPDLTHTRSPAPFQTSADALNMRTRTTSQSHSLSAGFPYDLRGGYEDVPRCSQRAIPLTGDPQGIPTGTPDHFPAQAEGLGGPCGTRGTPTLYRAIWVMGLARI